MKRHIGALIAFILGLILMIISVIYQKPEGEIREWIRVLSNAALFPGVLMTGLALMAKIAGEGLFDGIKYATGSILSHLRGSAKKYTTYYEYMHREKSRRTGWGLLPVGLFFLIFAVILTIMYYLFA